MLAGITRPTTPCGQIIPTRVFGLIHPVTGDWDIYLIKELFWEEDAQNILAISVQTDMEDSLVWHYDSKGILSVKSAYHDVLDDQRMSQSRHQCGETSSSTSISSTRRV